MRLSLPLEDIEELRRRHGIDDVELRTAIGALRIGSLVKLTFLPAPDATIGGETLPVRITRIQGPCYRGLLVARPASRTLAALQAGSSVAFTARHIHSVLKGQTKP